MSYSSWGSSLFDSNNKYYGLPRSVQGDFSELAKGRLKP